MGSRRTELAWGCLGTLGDLAFAGACGLILLGFYHLAAGVLLVGIGWSARGVTDALVAQRARRRALAEHEAMVEAWIEASRNHPDWLQGE